MEKIIVRYFYAPICPESFASVDHLYNLFFKFEKQINFESFNVFDCKFKSPYNWFPCEKAIIKSVNKNIKDIGN